MSIHSRVLIGIFLIVGVGMYFLADWVSDELKPQYRESTEEPLVDASRVLAHLAAEIAYEHGIRSNRFRDLFRRVFDNAYSEKFSAKIYDLEKTNTDFRVYITDEKGIVLFDSANGFDEGEDYSQWNDVYKTLRGQYGARTSRDDPSDPNSSVLFVASPIMLGGELIGVLAVGKPTRNANVFIAAAHSHLLLGALIAALGLLVISLIVSNMIVRPISKLTRYAREVRDGGNPRLPKLGTSETRDLGIAFEQMRDALEGKQYIERFVQGLTHEIKSPLSAIRGASELLQEDMEKDRRDKFLSNIRGETERLQTIVDKLLELASLEARKSQMQLQVIDLVQVAKEVQGSLTPVFEERGVVLELSVAEPCLVEGEAFLLERAISNLVINALEFSSKGAAVKLSVLPGRGSVTVEVEDEGPGVPEFAISKIFDRFYSLPRPASGKKSSGLGLNFVKEVVGQHGGEIRLDNYQQAGRTGARATLTLPSR